MGTRITKVTPLEGVVAETAGAFTLYLTEFLKIPVSTTHTITGAIIGVGATKKTLRCTLGSNKKSDDCLGTDYSGEWALGSRSLLGYYPSFLNQKQVAIS